MTEPDIDPQDVVPDWGLDPDASGTERQAEPPDGVDQQWYDLHPGGAREIQEGRL